MRYLLALAPHAPSDPSAAAEIAPVTLGVGDRVVLGRDTGCDVVIPSRSASRQHSELRVASSGTLVLRDLGSANGVTVGGERIRGEVELGVGDRFRIGEFELEIASAQPPPRPPSKGLPFPELTVAAVALLLGLVLGLSGARQFFGRGAHQELLAGNRLAIEASFEGTASLGELGWNASSQGGRFRVEIVPGGCPGGGNQSLLVTPAGTTLPSDRCTIEARELVRVSAEEALTLRVRTRLGAGAGPACVALDLLDASRRPLCTVHSSPARTASPTRTTSGGWQTLALTTRTPRSARYGRVRLLAFGGGTGGVWFDNVVLEAGRDRAGAPPITPLRQDGPLTVLVQPRGIFSAWLDGQPVITRSAVLVGDAAANASPDSPLGSQVFAALRDKPRISGVEFMAPLAIEAAGSESPFSLDVTVEQPAAGRIIARMEGVPSGTAVAWVVELAPEVVVQGVEPADPAPGLDKLTLVSGERTLDLYLSEPALLRVDPRADGATTLSMARAAEGGSGLDLEIRLR